MHAASCQLWRGIESLKLNRDVEPQLTGIRERALGGRLLYLDQLYSQLLGDFKRP